MNIGNAIKTCRTRRNMSLAQLAELVECSVSYLSLIERNRRHPATTVLSKISEALRVPVGILVFLASSSDELTGMSQDLVFELSKATVELLSDESK
ncbi:helix-turn-helix transcriptional regulator [uncultured Oxalobacter sp.]|uniref:helix-turn-helix domain-containing protein n=1 Tax=uncultured Oxalobacter sp. TaxID=337245 RepID=UPI002599E117|nr:helix-turn-helix transcriptional regulator [uncultured Oxalobacter sp.]